MEINHINLEIKSFQIFQGQDYTGAICAVLQVKTRIGTYQFWYDNDDVCRTYYKEGSITDWKMQYSRPEWELKMKQFLQSKIDIEEVIRNGKPTYNLIPIFPFAPVPVANQVA
jgi:hypothetical protein